jgi:hypothetical protein
MNSKEMDKHSRSEGKKMMKDDALTSLKKSSKRQGTSDGYMANRKTFNQKSPAMKEARKGYNDQKKADGASAKRGSFKI